jgi:hypothetical protein
MTISYAFSSIECQNLPIFIQITSILWRSTAVAITIFLQWFAKPIQHNNQWVTSDIFLRMAGTIRNSMIGANVRSPFVTEVFWSSLGFCFLCFGPKPNASSAQLLPTLLLNMKQNFLSPEPSGGPQDRRRKQSTYANPSLRPSLDVADDTFISAGVIDSIKQADYAVASVSEL